MYFDGEVRSFGQVNVEAFKKPLLEVPESAWSVDPRYRANTNFKDTRTLWTYTMPLTPDGVFHVFDKRSLFNEEFRTAYQEIHNRIEELTGGIVIRAGVIRLDPGMSVTRHIDGNHLMMQLCHRMLLAVITNPKMTYNTDDKEYCLEEGELYDVNGYVPHSTHNRGDTTRYSFALDILPKQYLNTKVTVKNYDWDAKLFSEIAATVPNKPVNGLMDNWQQHFENAKQNQKVDKNL